MSGRPEEKTELAQSPRIDRVPRSRAEDLLLLEERPPAWEWLLFAAVLHRGKEKLEPLWRAQQARTRAHRRRPLSEDIAPGHLAREFSRSGEIVTALGRDMSERSQRRAFGKQGHPGNPKRITALAERIVGRYEDMLKWSVDLRGDGVPQKFRTLYDLASDTADAPLRQFRDYITETVEQLDAVPAAIAQGKPVALTLTFAIAHDPGAMARFHAERDRLASGDSSTSSSFARRPIPERVRHEVWRRDGGSCVDCGSRNRLEFDHVIPISQGGSNTARNIELRCESCNRKKGARI